MQRFDCLARTIPLLGPHLLEASAGTGKTFAIEHVFARLLLEASLELEEILAITFTRAATRDLKMRIRENLKRVYEALKEKKIVFPYLEPFIGNPESILRIEEALLSFERAKISTIHGFCQRIKGEHSSDEPSSWGSLTPYLLDFLEGPLDFAPAQMKRVMRNGIETFVEQMGKGGETIGGCHLSEILSKWQRLADVKPAQELMQNFEEIARDYKKVEGDLQRQVGDYIRLLEDPKNREALEGLLWEKGTLFEFLSPENRSKRAKGTKGVHPLFEWGRMHLFPLIEEALDPEKILASLKSDWEAWWKQHPKRDEVMTPDALLAWTAEKCIDPQFAERACSGIRAVILDEFQDTDRLQWGIFERLFVDRPQVIALYLVGDPKQSIYRFRGADIYTYLQAKERLGDAHCYALDTNYRSSASLVNALNALLSEPFCRPWLHLPKQKLSLPYFPVRAGREERREEDGKGAIHVFRGKHEEELIQWMAQEVIEKLGQGEIAVLVRDRNQMERVLEQFSALGIPTNAKSQQLLSETLAFSLLQECMEAILHPRDLRRIRAVLHGPLGSAFQSEEEACRWFGDRFDELEAIGLPAVVGSLIRKVGMQFSVEWEQSVEALLEKATHTPESIVQFFRTFPLLDPLQEPRVRRRVEGKSGGVELLTLHASKGLEYDFVFAIGLIAASKEQEEEEERAEKLRQLYVAITRPKIRLYLPDLEEQGKTALSYLREHWEGGIETLAGKISLTIEEVAPREMAPLSLKEELSVSSLASFHPRERRRLLSFTALAKGEERHGGLEETPLGPPSLQTMPRGSETGVCVHRILEMLLQLPSPLEHIQRVVSEHVDGTALDPWKEVISNIAFHVLQAPLLGKRISLLDIPLSDRRVEVEFLYPHVPHLITGSIDLLVRFQDQVHLFDWKTNALPSYDLSALDKAMREGDYFLQAALYARALPFPLAGAHYLFVRGLETPGLGLYSFTPNMSLVDGMSNS